MAERYWGMARKLRVEFEGAIYHVTLCGVERRRLCDEERDRERFLAQLASGVKLDGGWGECS